MSTDRHSDQPSSHDAAIFAAAGLYMDFGLSCSIRPDFQRKHQAEKETPTIDLFVGGKEQAAKSWGIAFETTDSISANQARHDWLGYAAAFDHWYLAVPVNAETSTIFLLKRFNIINCSVVTWKKTENEIFCFWGLPGLPSGPHEKRSMYNVLKKR